MNIKLNVDEVQILKEAFAQLNYKIDLFNSEEKKIIRLNISDEHADEIRDVCTEYLEIVGFDVNYMPTQKGVLLETLVDKFFSG